MYIRIGSTTYSVLKEVHFSPEADVTGSQVPVNQFIADIITTDSISVGGDIYLYDDRNQLWAKFWLTDAYQLDDNTVRVTAQSLIAVLDRITLSAAIYNYATVSSVLQTIFANVSAIYGSTVVYELDSSFDSEEITGYVPEQSARERLQWVLMVIGAYCQQSFTDRLRFLPVSDTATAIPRNKVYYRPEYGVSDYVTAVTITSYSYVAGTPTTTDKYVEVNGVYYIQTSQEFTLANPSAPNTAPENIIKVSGVYLINADNVSTILSRLSTYYFMRGEVSASIINNRQYIPGQRVWLPIDSDTAYSGFIRSMDFSFGLQAKSSIKLSQTADMALATLIVNCVYNNTTLRTNTYYLPVGYEYTIEMQYIDSINPVWHIVYYPAVASISGTVSSGTNTETVTYAMAVQQDVVGETATIYSVDEVTQETDTYDETSIEVLTIS